MKIAKVETVPVNVPYIANIASASSKASGVTKCLIFVYTEDGIVGLGEMPGGADAAGQVARLTAQLVGQDPFRIEYLMERLPGPHRGLYGPTPTVLSGIEMALWDIVGKAANQPISNLFGGRYRDSIPVCAPLFTHEETEGEFAHRTLNMAIEVIETFGFGGVKVKAGVYRPGAEVEAVRLLREHFGDGITIRVDPNGVWSPEETIRLAGVSRSWIWSG